MYKIKTRVSVTRAADVCLRTGLTVCIHGGMILCWTLCEGDYALYGHRGVCGM